MRTALRTDSGGHVRLPAGLLRSMRLLRRTELWEELVQDRWLEMPVLRSVPVLVQLLDDAVLDQERGRGARHRAAHWALLHTTRTARRSTIGAADGRARAGRALLRTGWTRRRHGGTFPACAGIPPHQMVDLMDQLVAVRALAAWCPNRETDEVFWHLTDQRPNNG
ncbi:hypothetical protein [Streptomyces bobili]|uniref:hypothetical protein n=1 Tax=Streptomyces bobili TaxID=67280 RepID=UPI00382A5E8E